MLEISNLSIAYDALQVVHSIDLKIAPGETVALIGGNGAGKTTILRTISGLIRSKSGAVLFDGIEISKKKPHEIVKMGISHVPERRGIFANLTVLENLKMGAYLKNLSTSDYDEVFELFPRIKERQKQIAGTLSGGEQQMVAISRAMLSRPQVMLLDEPSLGLAPQVMQSIFQTIQNINKRGTTVLIVEQNARAALKIAHRGYVLEVGNITLHDEAHRLLENDSVRKAYLGEA